MPPVQAKTLQEKLLTQRLKAAMEDLDQKLKIEEQSKPPIINLDPEGGDARTWRQETGAGNESVLYPMEEFLYLTRVISKYCRPSTMTNNRMQRLISIIGCTATPNLEPTKAYFDMLTYFIMPYGLKDVRLMRFINNLETVGLANYAINPGNFPGDRGAPCLPPGWYPIQNAELPSQPLDLRKYSIPLTARYSRVSAHSRSFCAESGKPYRDARNKEFLIVPSAVNVFSRQFCNGNNTAMIHNSGINMQNFTRSVNGIQADMRYSNVTFHQGPTEMRIFQDQ